MRENAEDPRVHARETVVVLVIAAAFLALMLATMGRLSRPWWDEVQGAEVAANLLAGNGFTSAASLNQTRHQFYAANGPLFHLLMFAWLKLFGLSALAVRSFGYVLAAGTALAMWAAVARHRIILRPRHRVLLVVLLLCGLSMGRVYLNNRYDAPGICVAALLFLAASLPSAGLRLPCLFAGSLLAPFFGVQFAPYGGLIALGAFWLCGWSSWKDFAAILAGLAAGAAGVFLVWHIQGVLATFAQGARFDVPMLSSRFPQLGMFLDTLLRFQSNDTTILAAALALCLLVPSVRGRLQPRSALPVGLACAVGIPLAMSLAGRYSCVYTWMAFLPVAVCSLAALERELSRSRIGQGLVLAAVLVSCLVGVPAKIVLSAAEWEARDHVRLEQFVSQYIRAEDRVYCAFAAYYPAKKIACQVWTGCGWATMSPEERNSLSLIIVEPMKFGRVSLPEGPAAETALAALPGQWHLVDRYITRRSRLSEMFWPRYFSQIPLDEELFHLAIYRKSNPPKKVDGRGSGGL